MEFLKNKAYNKVYGNMGERLAVDHLESCGFEIKEKNYSAPFGEIDIICLDKTLKNNPVYVFVEVKYRNSKKYGLPREAITPSKQATIKKVAIYYLKRKHLFEKVSMRFDCVEIIDGERGAKPEITLLSNIF